MIFTESELFLYILGQYWDGNGPIFFYTGNEGPITRFWDNSGFVFEAAEKFNALVIFGEHVSDGFIIYVPNPTVPRNLNVCGGGIMIIIIFGSRQQ